MSQPKVKHLVIDSGPIIKGARLEHLAEHYWTVPETVREIRDEKARHVLETLPVELVLREPTPEAMKYVMEFSKKTGDFRSLSTVDLRLLALVYTLEKEAVGSTAHLRTEPAQPGARVSSGSRKRSGARPAQRQAAAPASAAAMSAATDSMVEGDTDTAAADTGNDAAHTATAAADAAPDAADAAGAAQPRHPGSGKRRRDRRKKLHAFRAQQAAHDAHAGGAEAAPEAVNATAVPDASAHNEMAAAPAATAPAADHDGAIAEASPAVEGEDEEGGWQLVRGPRKNRSQQAKRRVGAGGRAGAWGPAGSRVVWQDMPGASAAASTAPAAAGTVPAPPAAAEEPPATQRATSASHASRLLGNVGGLGHATAAKADPADDGRGWVSLDNLDSALDRSTWDSGARLDEADGVPVACMTTDFAMQNVLLHSGLKLLSLDGMVVRRLKQWALKCFACNTLCKDPSKLFCPRCGSDCLQRVSVAVADDGSMRVFERKKPPSVRGTVFSLPMPKGGKDQGLLLREDQLLMGMWKQRANKKTELSSAFGEDLTRSFGMRVAAGANVVVGVGRRNPNAEKGRTKRGKRKQQQV